MKFEHELPDIRPGQDARAHNPYKHSPGNESVIDPQYGTLVFRTEYTLINELECPPQYKHSPFVIA
ncbi:MAG: hypothetical protein J4452_03485 [Candidatus Aenigmarchaeota archaeon]|nr:hypothetical protein [Candidatus Aenigmarchaeota archaeon]